MEKLLIGVDDFATMSNLSKPKAYELVHSEGFPAIRVGRRILIPVDGLKAWIEQQTKLQQEA